MKRILLNRTDRFLPDARAEEGGGLFAHYALQSLGFSSYSQEVNAQFADYAVRFEAIKNEEKQQVQTSKQQAVDQQKAQIDKQFSQMETDVYEALNGSVK